MEPDISLYFTGNPRQLETTRFRAGGPEGPDECVAERGKTKNRENRQGPGSFEWREGVKALAILLLRYAAWGSGGREGPPPALKGKRPSAATSLDDALQSGTNAPHWLEDMFGLTYQGAPRIMEFIRRRNTGGKRGHVPVQIALDPDVLPPENIDVFVDDQLVDDSATLKAMVNEIESSERSWTKSPDVSTPEADADEDGVVPKPTGLRGTQEILSLPMGLRDHIRSFSTFIKDRRKDFTGREFVFDALKRFLTATAVPSGYFFVRGDPGIGKSSLMAELVERGLEGVANAPLVIHHFNDKLSGINTVSDFIGNICARLIAFYGLSCDSFPQDFARNGAFLNRILCEAAARLRGNEKLVIVVDALDEVRDDAVHEGTNPLFLPSVLPANVYFVLSSRHRDAIILQAAHVQPLTIGHNTPANRADVKAFVLSRASRPAIVDWISENGTDNQGFAELLTAKSEGNFMYLRHVLPEIEQGNFSAVGRNELPQGLREYYRLHWNQMRGHDVEQFEQLYRPVVCVLAAALESVPITEICRWTGLTVTKVKAVLSEWSEFLHVEPSTDGPRKYRVYHTAFQEFLEEEVDEGLQSYHALIAEAELRLYDDESSEE